MEILGASAATAVAMEVDDGDADATTPLDTQMAGDAPALEDGAVSAQSFQEDDGSPTLPFRANRFRKLCRRHLSWSDADILAWITEHTLPSLKQWKLICYDDAALRLTLLSRLQGSEQRTAAFDRIVRLCKKYDRRLLNEKVVRDLAAGPSKHVARTATHINMQSFKDPAWAVAFADGEDGGYEIAMQLVLDVCRELGSRRSGDGDIHRLLGVPVTGKGHGERPVDDGKVDRERYHSRRKKYQRKKGGWKDGAGISGAAAWAKSKARKDKGEWKAKPKTRSQRVANGRQGEVVEHVARGSNTEPDGSNAILPDPPNGKGEREQTAPRYRNARKRKSQKLKRLQWVQLLP